MARTSEQRQTLKQIGADAARLTMRRLEDDDFEPNYPNGYMADTAEVEEEVELTPLQKARAAKAAKAEQAKADAAKADAKPAEAKPADVKIGA
jgi:hypothetical protein